MAGGGQEEGTWAEVNPCIVGTQTGGLLSRLACSPRYAQVSRYAQLSPSLSSTALSLHSPAPSLPVEGAPD